MPRKTHHHKVDIGRQQLTLPQLVERCEQAYIDHHEGLAAGWAYDYGEFSGPAAGRAVERKVADLAIANGFTPEEVEDAMHKKWNEEYETLAADEGPYGRNE